MKTPALKINNSSDSPILVVDKIGVIGEAIARQFAKETLVVLLSEKLLSKENANIIHIPFKKSFPQAPDNQYSKIFIVDDGTNVTRESAFSFVDKAMENNAPLFFIGSVRNFNVQHADEVAKSYENAKVLIFGDLFDKNIFFDKESSISRFIIAARNKQKIIVQGDGLSLNFPITFVDTLKLIIKATQLPLPPKVILLFNQHPITDISLANIFKKLDPNLVIDFKKDAKDKKAYIPQGAMHALEKYDLEEKIKQLDLNDKSSKEIKLIKKKSGRGLLFPIFALFLLGIFILMLPLISTHSFLYLGEYQLRSSLSQVESGNLEKAISFAKTSNFLFEESEKTGELLEKEASVFMFGSEAQKIRSYATAGKDLSSGALNILNGLGLISKIYSGKSSSPKEDFILSSNFIKDGISSIQKSRAEDGLPVWFSKAFDNLEPFSDLLSNSGESLLSILGFDKEKNYLVLFEDSNRIRPGGGVVAEVGLIKIKDGKLTGFEKISIKDLEKSSKVNNEPPFPVRRYLGGGKLTMGDSSFDSDFRVDAKTASDIYDSAKNVKIDGVIGINSNLYTGLKTLPFLPLVQDLGKGIKNKNLVFSFSDPPLQNVFTTLGLSGSIFDQRVSKPENLNDYLGVVEANLGEGGNDFVSRTVSKKITLDDSGKITSQVTLVLKNSARQNYKDYIQFILPKKSVLSEIKINGQKQEIVEAITDPDQYEAKNFKPPKGLEVEQEDESDKTIVAFLVNVGAGDVKTIVLSSALPYLVTASQNFLNYSLVIYKQPGLEVYPVDIEFVLPQGFGLLDSKPKISLQLDGDKNITALISKK